MINYNSKQVEALILIRDGLTMALDGVNLFLESLEPKKTEKPTEQEVNTLNWITKDGNNGQYQQTTNDNSEAFLKLQEYLKQHNGFFKIYSFKFWFHNQDENVIDRKN